MGNLPSGTVTFLFTDIEGSTKLAQSLGGKWESLRARHHEILRSAIEANNGYVFQIIGDAFCGAFHNAQNGFEAAVQSQTDLQKEDWGDTPVKVRMGIHTGKAEAQENGQYQGYIALSLVQRIMDAGHGGQVLLSGATENLLRGGLPEGVDLLDMGRHNFKDVLQAVRVFQVGAPDLQRDFPPLRTFDILPNNLPAQLTSFVGREKELGDVKRLLADTHMLTLIGPGGTGKTRLSIQAANDVLNQYPDGVWLVDLAPILDPLLVPRTTAISMGLKSEPKRPVIDMLCDYLSKKKMLIILDNCEHLVDACAQMADRILHTAKDIKILASSREALGIAGEVTYRVPSLGLPDVDNLPSLETLSQYEAVKLFIDRATAAIPDFKVTNENAPALAQICHRLDGIPLAIELAAAKIRVLGVEQIAKRLDDRFKLLTGGSRTAMERHQTLRATVDWSYYLLPPEEQTLFRRLAVFRGGWTLEAAESVCGDDALELLEQLINKSLVITDDEQGVSRYRMLETIRQYANEKLVDSGKSEDLREKHLDFFLNLAETAEPHLYRHEQLEWLAQLDADYENLRAALDLALGKDSAELSLRLCAALGMYWHIRGYWVEGLKGLAKALGKLEDNQNHKEKVARILALHQDTALADDLDNFEHMKNSATSSLDLAEKAEDKRSIAISRYFLARQLWRIGNNENAYPLMQQAYTDFRSLREPYWEAASYRILDEIDEHKSHTRYLKSVELARGAGERTLLSFVLTLRAGILFSSNRLAESLRLAEEADMHAKQVGAVFNQSAIAFAHFAWLNGNYEQAESIIKDFRERLDLLGEKHTKSRLNYYLGRLAMDRGNLDQAKGYFEEMLEYARDEKISYVAVFCQVQLGIYYYRIGDINGYKHSIRECKPIWVALPNVGKRHALSNMLYPLQILNPIVTANILGMLENLEKDETSLPVGPLLRKKYDHAKSHVHEVLGDEAFESAYEEGQKISLDDALDLVLKSLEE